MASPEVERPMTSPSHPAGLQRTFSRSEEKRRPAFRYGRPTHQQKSKFPPSHAMASARRPSGGASNWKATERSGAANANFPVRKRSHSFSEGNSKNTTTVLPNKRWKGRDYRGGGSSKGGSSLKDSKKFLLGGNIRDPLNLNSLSDEKVARVVNAVTPESSPIPTPKHRKAEYKIEVLIPPNISDPLNLMQDDNDDDYDASFSKKKTRHRKRSRAGSKASALDSSGGAQGGGGGGSDSNSDNNDSLDVTVEKKAKTEGTPASAEVFAGSEAEQPPLSVAAKKAVTFKEPSTKHHIKSKLKEKQHKTTTQKEVKKSSTTSKKDDKKKLFEFGNYNRYYGYRAEADDPRLPHMDVEWFRGKDVLDIGCNVGQVTMVIARDMHPNSIIGIDIDDSLIAKARKNLHQYANRRVPSGMATPNPGVDPGQVQTKKTEKLFPQSLPVIFGALDPTEPEEEAIDGGPTQTSSLNLPSSLGCSVFPKNIKFFCDNYVLESDDLLEFAQQEFDTIMCLSTTKWIHLNFGDDGLKRAFKRMHAQLRPGGTLILEPQGLSSYARKVRRLTPKIQKNYREMKFKPDQFSDYLVNEVGFSEGKIVAVPEHASAGFRRPIHLFTKSPVVETEESSAKLESK